MTADPYAVLSKLDGPDHAAIGALRDAGLAVEVIAVEQATTSKTKPSTGQPANVELDVQVALYGDQVAAGELDDDDVLAYVEGLLIDYEQSRPRSTQVALGPSEIGHPCRRNIALKLAGFPEKRDGLAWAPLQGVWVHAGMEDVLAFDNAGRPGVDRPTMPEKIRDLVAKHAGDVWVVEGEVEVDDNIRGHSDAFLIIDGRVVDWKYAGKTAVNKLRAAKRRGDPPAKQVGQEYRVQGHLYGYAVRRKGRDVRRVSVVFLARSHDFTDSAVWAEEYREDVALWAIRRYYTIVEQVRELQLDVIPQGWELVPASPSPDACKWCPFKGAPCPGDTATAAKSSQRFGVGLI